MYPPRRPLLTTSPRRLYQTCRLGMMSRATSW